MMRLPTCWCRSLPVCAERLARAPRARGVQSSQGSLHEPPGSVGYREPHGQGDVHHHRAMAESESSFISERVKAGMAAAWARVKGLSNLKLLDAAQSSGGDHG